MGGWFGGGCGHEGRDEFMRMWLLWVVVEHLMIYNLRLVCGDLRLLNQTLSVRRPGVLSEALCLKYVVYFIIIVFATTAKVFRVKMVWIFGFRLFEIGLRMCHIK